jgi:hypothetical protein
MQGLKIMKKYILAIFIQLSLMNSIGFAQTRLELKLRCDVLRTDQYITGTIKKEQHSIVVEIIQDKSFLSILPNTIMRGVMTTKIAGVFDIYNNSDENKWDLTNIGRTEQEEKDTSTRIIIDRNTAEIFYEQDFQGLVFARAQGICSKIEITKKKF